MLFWTFCNIRIKEVILENLIIIVAYIKYFNFLVDPPRLLTFYLDKIKLHISTSFTAFFLWCSVTASYLYIDELRVLRSECKRIFSTTINYIVQPTHKTCFAFGALSDPFVDICTIYNVLPIISALSACSFFSIAGNASGQQ